MRGKIVKHQRGGSEEGVVKSGATIESGVARNGECVTMETAELLGVGPVSLALQTPVISTLLGPQ